MSQDNYVRNTALLVMDVQNATVKMLSDNAAYLQAVSRVIETARTHHIPVIYAVVGFRTGYPEVSPDNKSFSSIKKNTAFPLDAEHAFRVHAAVAPRADDIIVVKKRVSAFTGSDLEVVLRSLGIKHLILSGIATSGVVLSTLREAADKDYKLTVLTDCCADRDEEVHRVLLEKVFPRQAAVLSSDEWTADLSLTG